MPVNSFKILTLYDLFHRRPFGIDRDTFRANAGEWAEIDGTDLVKVTKNVPPLAVAMLMNGVSNDPYTSNDTYTGVISAITDPGVVIEIDAALYDGDTFEPGDLLAVCCVEDKEGLIFNTVSPPVDAVSGDYPAIGKVELYDDITGVLRYTTVSPTIVTIA